MNILFITKNFYPAQSGGPANSIYWLAKSLVHESTKISVVSTDNDIEINSIIRNKAIKFEGIETTYTSNFSNKYPINLIFKSIRPLWKSDIIHLNSVFFSGSLILFILSVILKKKIVLSVRGELDKFALQQGHPILKKLILSVYKTFDNKTHFHVTSNSEKNNVKKVFKSPLSVTLLPNLIDDHISRSLNKENHLLFMGRIDPIKCIDKLIIALSKSTIFPNSSYTLTIAGKGDDDNYVNYIADLIVKCGLSNKIYFPGKIILGDEKRKLYEKSKFLFLVSETENFGNVIIEGMCKGVVPIASLGTPWSILNKVGAGFHIENSIDVLSKKIDEIISMEASRFRKMSRACEKLVAEKFSMQKNKKLYSNFYNSL